MVRLQIWQRRTGSWVTVTGKRGVLITSHHARSGPSAQATPRLVTRGLTRRAAGQMVVDHPDGLQVAVHDGGPDEGEPAPLEVLAELVGQRGPGGQVGGAGGPVAHRRAVYPGPQVAGERPVLLLGGQ